MPIHDQGYRHYAGARGLGRGWWVIAATTVRAELRRRRVIALLLVAWLPFLVAFAVATVTAALARALFTVWLSRAMRVVSRAMRKAFHSSG